MDSVSLLVGRRFREIRDRRGFSQELLAEIVNCNTRDIAGYELGEHFPRIPRLLKIARALDVQMPTFLTFDTPIPDAKYSNEMLAVLGLMSRYTSEHPIFSKQILTIIKAITKLFPKMPPDDPIS